MVNPEKPYNGLPLIPPNFDCDQVDILKLVNKANLALAKLEGQTSITFSNFTNSMLLARTFTVREAVDSSRVENVATTVRDALKARALPDTELSPEEKETDKYSDATNNGYKRLTSRKILVTNDFIEIQKTLELPTAGIRSLPGYVIANERTKQIYYTPPEGERLIRDLLKNLEDYFNNKNDDPDPLIKMAVLHYQFEAIHPFGDGNGRTGRILMTLYLISQRRLRYPALFLSDYILNNKNEYYKKLRAVTFKGEWKEWIEFILNAVVKQANKTTEALIKISAAKRRFENKIPDNIPSFRKTDLLDFLFTTAAFSRDYMARQLDIHPNTASAYLKALEKAKLIDVIRHKNSKVFFVPTFVEILAR